MKQVLFLCSANYYRSRFAEKLFNHLAAETGLDWQAGSRGLTVGQWGNIGSISQSTIEALEARGVAVEVEHREPQPLTTDDLAESELVVAVKELEHRPEMNRQFPDWEERVEYWDVHDLDCATPDEALPYLETRVRDLVERLGNGSDPNSLN